MKHKTMDGDKKMKMNKIMGGEMRKRTMDGEARMITNGEIILIIQEMKCSEITYRGLIGLIIRRKDTKVKGKARILI